MTLDIELFRRVADGLNEHESIKKIRKTLTDKQNEEVEFRVIPYGKSYKLDYNENRVNLYLDAEDCVTQVALG